MENNIKFHVFIWSVSHCCGKIARWQREGAEACAVKQRTACRYRHAVSARPLTSIPMGAALVQPSSLIPCCTEAKRLC